MNLPWISRFLIEFVFLPTLGFLCLHFLFKPFLIFQKTNTDIKSRLTEYSNLKYGRRRDAAVLDSHWETCDAASKVLRGLASQLAPLAENIRFYWFFSLGKLVPSKNDLQISQGDLFWVSNDITSSDNQSLDWDHRRNYENRLRKILKT